MSAVLRHVWARGSESLGVPKCQPHLVFRSVSWLPDCWIQLMPGFCGRLLWYLGVGICLDPEPWCHVDLCCACLDACVVRVYISVVRVEVMK